MNDVAVVVEASFKKKVGADGVGQLDDGAVGWICKCTGDGGIACTRPAEHGRGVNLGDLIGEVVTEELEFVVDLVVNAKDIVANVDGLVCGRSILTIR